MDKDPSRQAGDVRRNPKSDDDKHEKKGKNENETKPKSFIQRLREAWRKDDEKKAAEKPETKPDEPKSEVEKIFESHSTAKARDAVTLESLDDETKQTFFIEVAERFRHAGERLMSALRSKPTDFEEIETNTTELDDATAADIIESDSAILRDYEDEAIGDEPQETQTLSDRVANIRNSFDEEPGEGPDDFHYYTREYLYDGDDNFGGLEATSSVVDARPSYLPTEKDQVSDRFWLGVATGGLTIGVWQRRKRKNLEQKLTKRVVEHEKKVKQSAIAQEATERVIEKKQVQIEQLQQEVQKHKLEIEQHTQHHYTKNVTHDEVIVHVESEPVRETIEQVEVIEQQARDVAEAMVTVGAVAQFAADIVPEFSPDNIVPPEKAEKFMKQRVEHVKARAQEVMTNRAEAAVVLMESKELDNVVGDLTPEQIEKDAEITPETPIQKSRKFKKISKDVTQSAARASTSNTPVSTDYGVESQSSTADQPPSSDQPAPRQQTEKIIAFIVTAVAIAITIIVLL